MNQTLVDIIGNAIEKTVKGLEEKASLLYELDQLMARSVPAYATFEQVWGKQHESILERIKNAECKAQLSTDAKAVRRIAVAGMYPASHHIAKPEIKNDIWLLENGLIFTPAELTHLRNGYTKSNLVMMRLIERYAKEHFPKNAREFAFENDDPEKYIRAIDTLAQLAEEAISDVNGAAAAKIKDFINPESGKADAEHFFKWANSNT